MIIGERLHCYCCYQSRLQSHSTRQRQPSIINSIISQQSFMHFQQVVELNYISIGFPWPCWMLNIVLYLLPDKVSLPMKDICVRAEEEDESRIDCHHSHQSLQTQSWTALYNFKIFSQRHVYSPDGGTSWHRFWSTCSDTREPLSSIISLSALIKSVTLLVKAGLKSDQKN